MFPQTTSSYLKDFNCHIGTTICFWLFGFPGRSQRKSLDLQLHPIPLMMLRKLRILHLPITSHYVPHNVPPMRRLPVLEVGRPPGACRRAPAGPHRSVPPVPVPPAARPAGDCQSYTGHHISGCSEQNALPSGCTEPNTFGDQGDSHTESGPIQAEIN